MKFSVIIPVYNAEKTLSRCLDSLIVQLPEDAEIVLVNDGSSDGSEKIALQYADNHGNIIYHRHDNSGVSYTRNVGLSLASGEYILFVDSDDYVAENYFSVLNENIADQPDLLLYGFKINGNARAEENCFLDTADQIYKKTVSLLRNRRLNSVWSKVFRKNIIEEYHIRFNSNWAIGEDLFFAFSYILRIRSLKAINELLYCVDETYRDSLSRKRRDYLCDQLYELHTMMFELLRESGLGKEQKNILYRGVEWTYYRSVYSIGMELLKYDYSYSERIAKILEVCDKYRGNRKIPGDIKTCCIALPIHMRMAWMIDMMSRVADMRRKRR